MIRGMLSGDISWCFVRIGPFFEKLCSPSFARVWHCREKLCKRLCGADRSASCTCDACLRLIKQDCGLPRLLFFFFFSLPRVIQFAHRLLFGTAFSWFAAKRCAVLCFMVLILFVYCVLIVWNKHQCDCILLYASPFLLYTWSGASLMSFFFYIYNIVSCRESAVSQFCKVSAVLEDNPSCASLKMMSSRRIFVPSVAKRAGLLFLKLGLLRHKLARSKHRVTCALWENDVFGNVTATDLNILQ